MTSYSSNGVDPNSSNQVLSEDTESVFCRAWPQPAISVATRYGLAVVSVSVAFVLAQIFLHYGLSQASAVLALSAIAITFWYGGTKPGILAASISWLVRDYLFEPEVSAESRLLYGLVFLVFALAMILVKRGRNELEARVAERTAELIKTNEDLTVEIARRGELHAIVDRAPVFLWSDLPDGYCDFLNQPWLTYFNLSLQEAQGAGWASLLHPDDAAQHLESWQKSVLTGIPFETEARYRRPDGEYRWFLNRANPLRDKKTGRIVKWYGTNIDIENLKRTEERLRQSEAYLAEAQRLSHSGVAAYNETTILYGSKEIYRIWGFDPAQGVPSREAVFQRIHPDDRDRLRAEVQRAVDEKRGYSTGYRIVLPDGTAKHIETIGQPVFSAGGELVEIVTTQIDVTERKRAEQTLRESEAKIRRLVDANIIGIIIWDFEGRIIEANDAFLRMVDYDREDLVSGRIRWKDLTPVEWREWDERAVAELRSIGTFQPFEKEYFRKDGTRVPVLVGGTVFEESGSEGVAFVLDLTERKCGEEALRDSEAKFREYAETASDWFWEIGPDYKVTLLTENAFGSYPADRIGTAAWDHALDLETEPEKWRLLRATLDSRKPFRDFVYCSAGRNGSPMYVKASGKPVFDADREFRGYRGTGTDVTASVRAQEEHERLRQLESDLAHMNRLSIMGELAASLVHEITQPIASARNNARAALNFLDKQLSDLGEVREALVCVVGDADRAGDIIDRIRDHIKKAPPRKDRFDLNKAIAEVIALAGSAITKNGVSVRTGLAEGLFRVQGDRVQLQQVVLNLILNAVEAMSSVEVGARELLISTEQSQMGGVLVAVRDSGPGIDPEHLERVFEAFYTTKSSGVGMGLSICRSIIDTHGGWLWADVNEPCGAVFQFTLPYGDFRGSVSESEALKFSPRNVRGTTNRYVGTVHGDTGSGRFEEDKKRGCQGTFTRTRL
jgi:PAS domain S-box-containing protein